MRGIRLGATAAVFAFAAAGFARAEDAPKAHDPWAAFKEGSTATHKTTTKAAGAPDQVEEERTTIVKLTEKEVTLKMEKKVGEAWEATEVKMPRVFTMPEGMEMPKPPTPEVLGEEKLKIDDTEYAVKKVKTTYPGGMTTISWENKDLGSLKSETTMGGDDKTTTVVTAVAKKVSVGGKELVCRETKTTTSMMGTETTNTLLTSDGVIGGTVRTESTSKTPAGTQSMVEELTAFETK